MKKSEVLILVVMESFIRNYLHYYSQYEKDVLILVVMESFIRIKCHMRTIKNLS